MLVASILVILSTIVLTLLYFGFTMLKSNEFAYKFLKKFLKVFSVAFVAILAVIFVLINFG